MRQDKIKLQPNGAILNFYVHEDNEDRPAVLIFPGGAYRYCSPGEGKPVAEAYYHRSYDAFVLEYSCTDGMFNSPIASKEEVFDSAIEDAMNAYYYLEDNADEIGIDKNRISIVGFSAGANLALASTTIGGLKPLSLILGYGAYTKKIGEDFGFKGVDLLERVTENTPPTFMFLCQADPTVPAIESLNLATCLYNSNVPFELHTYVTGGHGLSLGTRESGVVNKDYATWFLHSLHFIENIERGTPLILGDIDDDLENLSINSRLGALMHNEKAWNIIKELFPQIAFQAETDSSLQAAPLSRLWRWGIVKKPSIEEIEKLLNDLK